MPAEAKILLLRSSGPILGIVALFTLDTLRLVTEKQELIFLLLLIPVISPILRTGVSIACFSPEQIELKRSLQLHLITNLLVSGLLLIDLTFGRLLPITLALAFATASCNSFLFNYSQIKVSEGKWIYYWLQGVPLNLFTLGLILLVIAKGSYALIAYALSILMFSVVFVISLISLTKMQVAPGFNGVGAVAASWMSDAFNSFHTPFLLLGLAYFSISESGSEVALTRALLFIETLAVGILLPKLSRGRSARFDSNRRSFSELSRLKDDDGWIALLLLLSVSLSFWGYWFELFSPAIVSLAIIYLLYICVTMSYGYSYLKFFKRGTQRMYIYSVTLAQLCFWLAYSVGLKNLTFVELLLTYLVLFHLVSGLIAERILEPGQKND